MGALAVVCVVVLFLNLGGAALFDPDEGRNAEVAREAILLHDWITPHYDFIPYLDKPMSFFWLVAVCFRMFGVSAGAARLPSALAALGCVAIVWDLARRRAGPAAGWWTALILVTSPLFFAFARVTIFDMTLTFWIALALWAFHRALDARRWTRSAWIVAIYAAAACATLVKGPVGMLLPASIIVLDLLLTRRWGLLRDAVSVPGIAIFLIIAVPWYAVADWRNPGYLRYFLVEENALRYLTPQFNREGPWYYYLEVLILGWFPWTLLAYAVLRHAAAWHEAGTRLLTLWAIVPVLFFSASMSKLPGYILPAFPAVAVLTGESVAAIVANRSPSARRPLAAVWMFLSITLLVAGIVLFVPGVLPTRVADEVTAMGLPAVRASLWPFVAFGTALAALCARVSLSGSPVRCYIAACVCWCVVHVCIVRAATPILLSRSAQGIAQAAAPLVRSGDRLIVYDAYFAGLPFYLRANEPIQVVPVVRSGAILGSLYIAEKSPSPVTGGFVVLTDAQFVQAWRQSARLLVFTEKTRLARLTDELGLTPVILSRVGQALLISNQ